MADNQRIDDLRRRIQKDPASIAFAQLAEEHRRAGQFEEAVEVCRAGLAIHPGYLSAHVTLGRALLELNQVDDAQAELQLVLKSAPENLAAIRGLAEIFHRRGALSDALVQYRAALSLARNDPDLEQFVAELTQELAPKGHQAADGLSLAQMQQELSTHAPAPAPPLPTPPAAPAPMAAPLWPPPMAAPPLAPPPLTKPALAPSPPTAPPLWPPSLAAPPPAPTPMAAPTPGPAPAAVSPLVPLPPLTSVPLPPAPSPAVTSLAPVGPADSGTATPPAPTTVATVEAAAPRAQQTVDALEQWLDAIHAARAEPRP